MKTARRQSRREPPSWSLTMDASPSAISALPAPWRTFDHARMRGLHSGCPATCPRTGRRRASRPRESDARPRGTTRSSPGRAPAGGVRGRTGCNPRLRAIPDRASAGGCRRRRSRARPGCVRRGSRSPNEWWRRLVQVLPPPHVDLAHRRRVSTNRTARSRSSGEHLVEVFIGPVSQELGSPGNPARFSRWRQPSTVHRSGLTPLLGSLWKSSQLCLIEPTQFASGLDAGP